MVKIKNVQLRTILNSAGKEALEVEMIADNNFRAIASSPSAIIPGRREVTTTNNVNESILNEMITKMCNTEIESQKNFDDILNTYMKDLGTNICLPFSLAFARLMAKTRKFNISEIYIKYCKL